MKQGKINLISTLLALFVLAAVIGTSCTNSNKCYNVVCLNGGTCSAGKCTCPSGFTGSDCSSPAEASITYTNDTKTPVKITANGASATIAVGGSATYYGLYGNPLNVVASTSGMGTTTSMVTGAVFTWNLSEVFPQGGASNYSINVDSTYFYLYLQNNSTAYSAQGVYVNYANATYQTFDNVSIPNNGQVYGVGYYRAFDSTQIYVNASTGSGGTFWSTYAFIPPVTFTKNQTYTFTFN